MLSWGIYFRLFLGTMIPQQIILRFLSRWQKTLLLILKACYGKAANLIPRETYGKGILREAENYISLLDLFVTHAHTYLCTLLNKIIKWN